MGRIGRNEGFRTSEPSWYEGQFIVDQAPNEKPKVPVKNPPEPHRRAGLRKRLEDDFQFAMIVAFGMLSSTVILGFAAFRFLTGNTLAGMLNLGIAALILVAIARAVVSERNRLAGIIFVTSISSGAFASTWLLGSTGLMWSYLALWINFVLTERRIALTANVGLLMVISLTGSGLDSGTELTTYLITSSLVTCFAYIFATRLSHQQEQLELLATRDPLTQTGNRRSLRADLLAAVNEHRRSKRPYTLMLLDLDHFKQLNDSHGHEAGDQALREFAGLLRANIRAGDSVYRFGGEEFVVLFPDTDGEVAERVTRALHESASGQLSTPAGLIRFSAGVAVLRQDQSMDDWLAAADSALYQAKSEGRGQVKLTDHSPHGYQH